jgi:diguanylate cyclase (GGDEF)-like protein
MADKNRTNSQIKCSLINGNRILSIESESEKSPRNVALIQDANQSVLFQGNQLLTSEKVFKSFMQLVDPASIKYLVFYPTEFLPTDFMKIFGAANLRPIIVTDAMTAGTWKEYSPEAEFFVIDDTMQLELSPSHILRFIRTPFFGSPNSFLTYDDTSHTIFSGDLFSTPRLPTEDNDSLKTMAIAQEKILPSSDFLKPIIKTIKKLEIDTIIPNFGPLIVKDEVQKTLDFLQAQIFYNSNLLVKSSTQNRRIYDYVTLGNQVIAHLKSLYKKEEVLQVFQGTTVAIDPETMEITGTLLPGYKFWNQLFEVIFNKKGPEWLVVLEPMVNKLSRTYNIKKPAVYSSSLITSKFENIALQSKVNYLQDNLDRATNKLLHDPVTGAYNDYFLRNYLSQHIAEANQTNSSEDFSLLFIDIDNIRKLNLMYSKETGNETMRNLHYLLNQNKDENQVVFKRNGPGFVLFCTKSTFEEAVKKANQIRNAVADSDSFVEKITVSVGITRFREFNSSERQAEGFSEVIYDRGETRVKTAYSKGQNRLIDEKTKNVFMSIGKILIVDTDEIVQNIFSNALKNNFYEVVVAKNGIEALSAFDNDQIDFIICEKNIPKLDGFKLKAKLNETPETQTIPFVLTTFNKNLAIVNTANELNVDFILTKPLIIEEVVGLVKRILSRRTHL